MPDGAYKLTEEREKEAIEAIKEKIPISWVAHNIGVTRQTFRNWLYQGHAAQLMRENGKELNDNEIKLANFYVNVKKAQASHIIKYHFNAMAEAGAKLHTIPVFDKDGKIIYDEDGKQAMITKSYGDYRANRDSLEKMFPLDFGPRMKIEEDAEPEKDMDDYTEEELYAIIEGSRGRAGKTPAD
jgi:hypothetical protein